MLRSQYMSVESLESRTFMSAATLSQDEANLSAAVTQYGTDKATAKMVLLADKAAVKAHKPQADPAVVPLIDVWQEAMLTRDNTLIADRSALTTSTNTDRIAVLQDHMNILADRQDGNTAQLAIDKSQLNTDQLKLANDRKTLGDTLANDIITTKVTIVADHEAVLAKRLADGADPSAIALKQTLIDDSIHWTDTLATDHKTVIADQLIVSEDRNG